MKNQRREMKGKEESCPVGERRVFISYGFIGELKQTSTVGWSNLALVGENY